MHSPGTVNNPFLAPWAHTATSNRRIPWVGVSPVGKQQYPKRSQSKAMQA